jgi:hypothetical protein
MTTIHGIRTNLLFRPTNALEPLFLSITCFVASPLAHGTNATSDQRPQPLSPRSTECATETAKNVDRNSAVAAVDDATTSNNHGSPTFHCFRTIIVKTLTIQGSWLLLLLEWSFLLLAALYDRVPTVGQTFCGAFVSRGSISEYECFSHVNGTGLKDALIITVSRSNSVIILMHEYLRCRSTGIRNRN